MRIKLIVYIFWSLSCLQAHNAIAVRIMKILRTQLLIKRYFYVLDNTIILRKYNKIKFVDGEWNKQQTSTCHNTTTTMARKRKKNLSTPESLNSFYVIMRWCSHSGSQKDFFSLNFSIPPRYLLLRIYFHVHIKARAYYIDIPWLAAAA